MEKKEIIYVSLNGDDSFSGRYPERKGNDGPFLTLQRAFDEIVKIKEANKGALNREIIIQIREGTYFLEKPIIINYKHSGTGKFSVIVMPYENEKVIISGGVRIKEWKEEIINGKRVWVSKVKKSIKNLWVNGERRLKPRYPEKGYLKVENIVEEDEKKNWNEGVWKLKFKKGEIKNWNRIEAAELIVMNRWVESRLPIKKVDEENSVVEFKKRTVFKLEKDDLYYIENCLEFLKEGEWFFDEEEKIIYYMPLEGEKIEELEIIGGNLVNTIRIIGSPEENKYVENIHFKNIQFSHTEWYFYEKSLRGKDVGGFAQAAVEVEGGLYCEGIKNCSFEDCEISHIGNYGIEFGKGCRNNKILKCKFFDLGAGGIKIGERIVRKEENLHTYGNEISECLIKDGGKIFHSAVGIWIGQSYKNLIFKNEISDFYYTGISIGWTWGYGETLAGENIVKFNHVYNIGKKSNGDGPILSDMGGIYTLGIQKGTVISNNVFHDIAGYKYGGWGIYLDEGSSFIIVENNLVYKTTHGGFHQHYGRENIIRNNVFAFGRDWQIQISRPENHIRFIFENNVVVGETEKFIEGAIDFNFVFNKNIYWKRGKGEIKFGEFTIEEWKNKGMDKNSIIHIQNIGL